jgi:exopolyphosphatase/guanosine-5'-triphosphate,3'-diphosphate pyrophosphatase
VTETDRRKDLDTLASLDLGSNSFHMVLARVAGGEVTVVNRVKEPVRLAAGLDGNDELDDDAMERGLACLERFGQMVRDFKPANMRAVGTNTLRRARNRAAFVERAEKVLGHPIEIISGVEEARLVYLGVAHSVADDDGGNRIVVDIGGGSTECILGEAFTPLERDSLYMGCVSYTNRFFKDGKIDKKRFAAARLAAAVELEPLRRPYRTLGWSGALGSSGTIGAVDAVLREAGRGPMTPDSLRWLEEELRSAGKISAINLPGLKRERVAVLPGGLAILQAIFESFSVDRMTFSSGALREGILYDLLGRIRHEDRRDQTIRAFQERYSVDRRQAARVERTAVALLNAVADSWDLEDDAERKLLVWAARLHEVGMAISYRSYHKHGAYLLRHSDMAGFSIDDQVLLSTLVRAHRRKMGEETFAEVGPQRAAPARRLAALLRVAVVVHRSRRSRRELSLITSADEDTLALSFPDGWLDDHPLTRADLALEAKHLGRVGITLRFG